MKTIELYLNDGSTIHLLEDGCWFYFTEDGPDMMKLVVPPVESNYSYSHGGAKYREAMEVIAKHKEVEGWGFDA
jgi:hypothetical protein